MACQSERPVDDVTGVYMISSAHSQKKCFRFGEVQVGACLLPLFRQVDIVDHTEGT